MPLFSSETETTAAILWPTPPPLPRPPSLYQPVLVGPNGLGQRTLHSTFFSIKIGRIAYRDQELTLKMESYIATMEWEDEPWMIWRNSRALCLTNKVIGSHGLALGQPPSHKEDAAYQHLRRKGQAQPSLTLMFIPLIHDMTTVTKSF